MMPSVDVRMNCDGVAPYYEVLERMTFGRNLEHCRYTFLEHTQESQCALLCGDGDGRFLEKLLSWNRQVEVDYVDSSAKMLELAEWRAVSLGKAFRKRVQFHHVDIRELGPRPSGYDLFATHFFLDCFDDSELPGVVRRIASWSAPHAQWLLSDFRVTDGTFARIWSRAAIRSLYAAFRITTGLRVTHMPDYRAALGSAGWRPHIESNSLAGLLYAAVWIAG